MAKFIRSTISALVAGFFVTASLPGESAAQAPRKQRAPTDAERSVLQYWTPERLRNAKPFPLPTARPDTKAAPETGKDSTGVRRAGRPPSVEKPRRTRLFTPKAGSAPANEAAAPRQTSNYGAFFTTTRVFPIEATEAYPYSAAGKLFFHDPEAPPPGDFICSASVIDRRIVVTAGHCVYNPEPAGQANDYFFEDFLFIPSYDRGDAPFNTWTEHTIIVSGEWAGGNGSLPNAQDVGLFIMDNKDVQGSSAKERIGAVTGTLGFVTNSLKKQHVTMIGWPGNLDQGERMIASYAEAFKNVSPNAVEFGSAMKGGSSGGPWAIDFGEKAGGQGSTVIGPLVVSVTSYQPANQNHLFLGGSILNDSFLAMYDDLCDDLADACF